MVDKYEWFTVEGIIVGWLDTSDDENDSIMEHDVAIVQADDGHSFIRFLINDWERIDPPSTGDGIAAIGTRIRFDTNMKEQTEYGRIARGESK